MARRKRIKISRSKSNPGELRFDLPDPDALFRMQTVFPDLTAANIYTALGRDVRAPEDWPIVDSLRYKQLRGGEQGDQPGHWESWTWWEDKRAGVDGEMVFEWVRSGDRVDQDKPWQLRVALSPRGRLAWERERALRWTVTYPQRRPLVGRRIDAKSYFMRSLQRYLNDVVTP